MKVDINERLPIKMWLEDIEEGAMIQARNLANLPFTFRHVALMPDCHQGYGMPIGGVLATKGVVIPNAVGVDIGCGMCAVHTGLKTIGNDQLKAIMGKIREKVPVGRNHHKEDQNWEGFSQAPDEDIVTNELNSAKRQLGTLGGGNHFIEIQRDKRGMIWIMIHSGSRNFGYKIAKYYNELAQILNTRWYSNIPAFKGEDGLAFLPLKTNEAHEYLLAMNYAVKFAFANRQLMLERVKEAFAEILEIKELPYNEEINIAHNYAAMEHHFGQNVIVHRKGATSAKEGELGIIPGSQGTKSYIVKGLGNIESFKSCSHGAGRKMGRKEAQRTLDLDKEKKILDDQGIIHSIRNEKDLDESPSAYKDIAEVMYQQRDLVEVLVELTPMAVIKG